MSNRFCSVLKVALVQCEQELMIYCGAEIVSKRSQCEQRPYTINYFREIFELRNFTKALMNFVKYVMIHNIKLRYLSFYCLNNCKFHVFVNKLRF